MIGGTEIAFYMYYEWGWLTLVIDLPKFAKSISVSDYYNLDIRPLCQLGTMPDKMLRFFFFYEDLIEAIFK